MRVFISETGLKVSDMNVSNTAMVAMDLVPDYFSQFTCTPGKEFALCLSNTHMDFISKIKREKGATLTLRYPVELDSTTQTRAKHRKSYLRNDEADASEADDEQSPKPDFTTSMVILESVGICVNGATNALYSISLLVTNGDILQPPNHICYSTTMKSKTFVDAIHSITTTDAFDTLIVGFTRNSLTLVHDQSEQLIGCSVSVPCLPASDSSYIFPDDPDVEIEVAKFSGKLLREFTATMICKHFQDVSLKLTFMPGEGDALIPGPVILIYFIPPPTNEVSDDNDLSDLVVYDESSESRSEEHANTQSDPALQRISHLTYYVAPRI